MILIHSLNIISLNSIISHQIHLIFLEKVENPLNTPPWKNEKSRFRGGGYLAVKWLMSPSITHLETYPKIRSIVTNNVIFELFSLPIKTLWCNIEIASRTIEELFYRNFNMLRAPWRAQNFMKLNFEEKNRFRSSFKRIIFYRWFYLLHTNTDCFLKIWKYVRAKTRVRIWSFLIWES